MRYEWDELKNERNQRKHGISFELATTVFEDDLCLVRRDRVDENGEQRWLALGAARISHDYGAVLLVVHVYRENNHGEEVIRIVSARAAEKHDVGRYQEQTMD